MKVAIVTPFNDPEVGACVVRVRALKKYFLEKGAEVDVLAPKRKGASGKERYASLRELFGKVFRGKYDLVIGTSPPLPHNFFALFAAKLRGSKFILDAKDDGYFLANTEEKKKSVKFRIYSFLRVLTYKFSDMTIYLTKEDLELEKKRYNLGEQLLVPNGSVEEVSFDQKSRVRIRKKANFSTRDVVGCYNGSIGDEDIKGLLENSNGAKFIFVVTVSKDKYGKAERKFLQDLLKKYSPKSIVFENSSQKDLGKYISAADYGALPWNDFMPTSIPVKLFDYISVGIPVITKGYKNTAVERFHKENDIGYFTTLWSAFFNKVKIVKKKKIDKNLSDKFLRKNYISKLFEEIEKKGWTK